jgi:hypothetical protein
LLDNGGVHHDSGSRQDSIPVETFWESFRLDPREPKNAPMRASDADREAVRTVLADGYADGRLTREEYDERLSSLYGTRTLGQLPALVSDLVLPDGPAAPSAAVLPRDDLRALGARKWRKNVEESVGGFLVPSIICTVIYVAVGGQGFFWPLFPMLFLGLNVIKSLVQRESVIEREVLRLQKQAATESLPPSPGDPAGEAKAAGQP